MAESRVRKSLLNAKVNLIFYVLTLALSFFSRKTFLDCLGADFVGLTGTLQNLLGFLNLAELGVGAAIGYVLYKPLFNDDRKQINEIISVFGYLYRWIGFIILGLGVILACFLPLIFPNTGFELGVIYAAYFSFLASSLIGYFINFKQTLLGADQRNYVVTGYFQTCNIVKILIQMASARYTGSYYLWVAIELAFGIVYSFILNWRIRVVYPWLNAQIKQGRKLRKGYGIIISKARQLFVHKLAGVARFQLMPFLIYVFASLEVVAQYGNYTIIVDKIAALIETILGSTEAGVGNLIAEGSPNKIMNVYWELNTVRYYVATVFVFPLYHLTDPFISLWVGDQYVVEYNVLILILLNAFFVMTRGTNDQFLFGFGLFSDTWAPLASLIMTACLGIALGSIMGLEGVLLGNVISLAIMLCVWKPYFLYSRGFKKSISSYWIGIVFLLLPGAISWWLGSLMIEGLNLCVNRSFMMLLIDAFIEVAIISILYFLLLLMFNYSRTISVLRRLNILG